MIVELETVPVHFFQTEIWNDDDTELIQGWQYWAETGFTSGWYESLGKAIAAAKQEVNELVGDYGCLPMMPIYEDLSWLPFSPDEF